MRALRRTARSFPLWTIPVGVPIALTWLATVWSPVAHQIDRWPDWHWISAVNVPAHGQFFLAVVVLSAVATRLIVRRSAGGPITVGEIHDATGWSSGSGSGDRAPTGSALALLVQALLRERIARAGQEPVSIVPSYGGIDVATDEPVATAADDTYGLLARLGESSWRTSTQRQGWRVTGTLKRSERGERYGLTVVLQHVATRRHAYTHTAWADSPQEAARMAAYEVASWRQQRLSGASTRRSPDWRPTALAMRHYEDATYFSSERRLDEAIASARSGLAADPSNIALRRVLGESYERLGHFLSAMHVYASGIVMLLDVQNGWSRTVHASTGAGGSPGWPRGSLSRAQAAESSGPLWRRAEGLLWRYVVVLLFADQWVDRWIADVERVEAGRRLRWNPRTGRRWTQLRHDAQFPHLVALSADELRAEADDREEQAKRLRGFFHRRYAEVMRAEFPLLEAAWFGALHDRREPFHAPVSPAATAPGVKTPALGAAEYVEQQVRRTAPRRGRPDRWRRSEPVESTDLACWVARLHDVFGLLDALEQELAQTIDAQAAEQALLGTDELPDSVLEVLVETHQRLGTEWGAGQFGEVAQGLYDSALWRRHGLDRQLVTSVASWAVHHLLHLDDGTLLTPASRFDLLRLRAQLDLRLFFFRAGMDELDHARSASALWGLGQSFEVLQDLLWLTARFRYLDRVHHLMGLTEGKARAPGADPGELDPRDSWTALRLDTAREARELTARRGRFRGLWPATEEWSIWYYAACAHALVIPDPGNGVRFPTGQAEGDAADAALNLWKRRYDSTAEYGVRALNHAMLIRGRRGRTLIEAGAGDWMLYEDPDLENLRRHPRFLRWASAAFVTALGNPSRTVAEMREFGRYRDEIRRREWRNEGTFGMESRWGPSHVRWWLVNNHYLAVGVDTLAPRIAARWRRLGADLSRAARPLDAIHDEVVRFAELLDEDLLVWRRLGDYQRFAARPDLRLAAGVCLAHLAQDQQWRMPYPTSREVLAAPRRLDYSVVDAVLEVTLVELETCMEQVRRLLTRPLISDDEAAVLVAHCVKAAARWDRLIATVE